MVARGGRSRPSMAYATPVHPCTMVALGPPWPTRHLCFLHFESNHRHADFHKVRLVLYFNEISHAQRLRGRTLCPAGNPCGHSRLHALNGIPGYLSRLQARAYALHCLRLWCLSNMNVPVNASKHQKTTVRLAQIWHSGDLQDGGFTLAPLLPFS
jgi:hypothetical protein